MPPVKATTSGLLSQWQLLTASAGQLVEYRPDVDVALVEIDFVGVGSLAAATVVMEAAGSSVCQGAAIPIPALVDTDAVDLISATFGNTYKVRLPVPIKVSQAMPLRFRPSAACSILCKGLPIS